MKVLYIRVSTQDQNEQRQLKKIVGFDYVLVDKCSGNIPLWDRPQGGQIRKLLDDNKLTHLEVHSPDRLGRNLQSTLEVWNELTSRGVLVVCRNPGFRNFNEEGAPDKFSELMLSLLASMAAFERDLIRERQMEGIELRKAKGLYRGRQIGTRETIPNFLLKSKSKEIVKLLNRGFTFNDIQKITGYSPNLISKVKKAASTLNEA